MASESPKTRFRERVLKPGTPSMGGYSLYNLISKDISYLIIVYICDFSKDPY